MRWILLAGALLAGGAGPYDIRLLPTAAVPAAVGDARLVFAASPFGIAVTVDGIASYDVQVSLSGLPEPGSLGGFSTYIAWAVTSDLKDWRRLGRVGNGATTVGPVAFNKFLLVISAEADTAPAAKKGPIVLRGISPSAWLQSFLTHPLFRGIPPG